MSDRPYLNAEHPIRFAHRGSRILWPENTLYAFHEAVGLGYQYIETDIRVTRDGVVVVFHDEDLERLTNGVGKVRDWDWDDIKHLDAAYNFTQDDSDFPLRGTGITIPRLDETFDVFPDVRFNIDLKPKNAEWAVADVVVRKRRQDSVLIGGFVDARAARFRRITKSTVATSAGSSTALAMYAASRVGKTVHRQVDAYQLPDKMKGASVDRKLVDAIHNAGAHIHVWTVDEPHDMNRLLDLGVDGIVTDRPDVLNAVLADRSHNGEAEDHGQR
jgi:glycerophosphoryl diester phosphodiesterase